MVVVRHHKSWIIDGANKALRALDVCISLTHFGFGCSAVLLAVLAAWQATLTCLLRRSDGD